MDLFYRDFTIFIAVGIMQMSTFTFFKLGILKLTCGFLIFVAVPNKKATFLTKEN